MRRWVLALASAGALACEPDAAPDANVGDAALAVREDAEEIPCEPRRTLQAICQKCHARTPVNGAPFPLVRRSDVLAVYSGVVVRELMIEQVEARRMPLAPVTIGEDARAGLLAWLRAGAPAIPPQSCALTDGGLDDGAVNDGGRPDSGPIDAGPDGAADSSAH